MDYWEGRFERIDARVAALRISLATHLASLTPAIERHFTLDAHIYKLNTRRDVQLAHLDTRLVTLMRSVSRAARSPARVRRSAAFAHLFHDPAHPRHFLKQLDYLKSAHDSDHLTRAICVDTHAFARLTLRAELSVFHKFYYFHLYQSAVVRRRRPAPFAAYQFECFHLSRDACLVQDLAGGQLMLVNQRGTVRRRVTLRAGFTLRLFKVMQERVVLVVGNALLGDTHVCTLDFELRVCRCRRLRTGQLLVNFGPSTIAVFVAARFVVLDLELNEVDCIDDAQLFRPPCASSLAAPAASSAMTLVDAHRLDVVHDRLLIKDFRDSTASASDEEANQYSLRIVSRASGRLIRTIPHLAFFISRLNLFVKADAALNIYVVNTCADDAGRAHLFCYDRDGRLRFRRFLPCLADCYYIDFVGHSCVAFSYLNEVDLF